MLLKLQHVNPKSETNSNDQNLNVQNVLDFEIRVLNLSFDFAQDGAPVEPPVASLSNHFEFRISSFEFFTSSPPVSAAETG
jgi:hypothetical protein